MTRIIINIDPIEFNAGVPTHIISLQNFYNMKVTILN